MVKRIYQIIHLTDLLNQWLNNLLNWSSLIPSLTGDCICLKFFELYSTRAQTVRAAPKFSKCERYQVQS